MAYTDANWANASASLNQGQETVTPFGGSPTVLNSPNLFTYGSPNDTVATIEAANYFLSKHQLLCVNDIILGNGTDASFALVVTAVSSTSVTTASMGLTASIGTANIQNAAVTYAKIQNEAASSILGNPTGAPASPSEITLGNGLSFVGTTLQVPNTNLIYTTVAITAAQWNGMYAAPKLLVAAPGANKLIVVNRIALLMTFVSAAYAGGGVVLGQYDTTVHGAGDPATVTETAADFFAGASTAFLLQGSLSTGAAFTTSVNKGLYLSNQTGAFITGDSTWVAHVWYSIIPSV